MKLKYKNSCISVFLIVIFTACSAMKHENEIPPNLRRDWKLVALNGFDKDFLVKNNAGISMQQSLCMLNAGCEPVSFKVKAETSGDIRFWGFNGITNVCPANSGLQKAVVKGLKNTLSYQIDGHFLTLYTRSGETLKLIAQDWD